ncbi:MAG: hypothetical protein FJ104_06080, partial [Deltaproteobacteria bacterium]|nr:hypothetical protein [Deltaproteobacteria bacterium]
RVAFAAAGPRAGKKPTGTVELAIQTGPRSALPTIELSFALEPEGKTDADLRGPSEVVARAVSAKLAKTQPGALPPGLDAEVAKLKGGRLRWLVAPSGAGRLIAAELPASVEPSLGQVLGSAGDALSLVFTPYPTEPVGVGAYWMVTSRDRYAGLDVVAYRMVKVEASDASGVTLSVNTRRFAAGGSFALPGIPPHRVEQFQGNTSARLLVNPAEPSSLRGEAQDVIGVGMVTTEAMPRPGAPPAPAGEKIGLELRIRAALAFKP